MAKIFLLVAVKSTKRIGVRLMREHEERWKELCAKAEKEQDPAKLRELVAEINRLLARKQKRLDGQDGD
jgi:hypothetical protein